MAGSAQHWEAAKALNLSRVKSEDGLALDAEKKKGAPRGQHVMLM